MKETTSLFFEAKFRSYQAHKIFIRSLLTLVYSKPQVKLSPFSLPVRVETQIPLWVWFCIRHQENDSSSTMPTRCVAAVCSNTHCDFVSLLGSLGILTSERMDETGAAYSSKVEAHREFCSLQ